MAATALYSHSRLKIIPSSLPRLPYTILQRFFGNQTMCYLQFHTVCDKLYLIFCSFRSAFSRVQPHATTRSFFRKYYSIVPVILPGIAVGLALELRMWWLMVFHQIVRRYSEKVAAVLILTLILAADLPSWSWAGETSRDMCRYFFPETATSPYIVKEPTNLFPVLTASVWEAMMKGHLMRSARYSMLLVNLRGFYFP
jgi:hypothetical protein